MKLISEELRMYNPCYYESYCQYLSKSQAPIYLLFAQSQLISTHLTSLYPPIYITQKCIIFLNAVKFNLFL